MSETLKCGCKPDADCPHVFADIFSISVKKKGANKCKHCKRFTRYPLVCGNCKNKGLK